MNLKKLESDLKTVIFGQDTAIKSLVNAIKLSRAGLRDDNKTIGSFLFAGPTGVGKTEITTQLANMMGIELVRLICLNTWKDILFQGLLEHLLVM